MEMEGKESTESGSPGGNSDYDSPPSSGGASGGAVVPEIINTATGDKIAEITSSPGVALSVGVIEGSRIKDAVIISSDGALGGTGELMMGKKKRGRPRKYDSEGNLRPGYVRSAAQTPSSEYTLGSKRGRGRPSGSGIWKTLGSLGQWFGNTAGGDFAAHVVTVYRGEDIAGKILAVAQTGSRGVCVLSANGSVSNVTIRQPASSGGLLTYEGHFEILSLKGSYTISESGGIKSGAGGLSISLGSPDGRIIGGGVAGLLMAATPIQVVVGSFIPNSCKSIKKRRHNHEPKSSHKMFQFSPAIPISQESEMAIENQREGDNKSLSNKD